MHELQSRKRVDVSICMQCQRNPSRKVAKNQPRWSAGEESGSVQTACMTSHWCKWSIVFLHHQQAIVIEETVESMNT